MDNGGIWEGRIHRGDAEDAENEESDVADFTEVDGRILIANAGVTPGL